VSHRYTISMATAILLVVLRLNIGWHFFSEGVKHYTDPQWTSAPVLRNATGPLAPMYRSYLPDFHGMDYWLHGERTEKPAAAVQGWIDQVQSDWDERRQQFAVHYGLDEKQQKQATKISGQYQGRARSWSGRNKDDLVNHVHQWRRQEASGRAPDAKEVPFREQRVAAGKAELTGQAGGWQAELAAIERDYENSLSEILTDEQRASAPLPPPAAPIDKIDRTMTYAILGIGTLLLLGLFTRTACAAGALFLLSVVMTQPFWVTDAQPTFNQFVEMFALLALATTEVGRWGGLDYFVHSWFSGRKGTSDVSES